MHSDLALLLEAANHRPMHVSLVQSIFVYHVIRPTSCNSVESRHLVGAELAVQSQQRQTTVHDTHSCSQHCLIVLEQVGLELALE